MDNWIYNVIESRGYGISYVEFTGSLEDCQKFLEKRIAQMGSNPEEYENGNGDEFAYYIEEAE
jgi:hypothetical protein